MSEKRCGGARWLDVTAPDMGQLRTDVPFRKTPCPGCPDCRPCGECGGGGYYPPEGGLERGCRRCGATGVVPAPKCATCDGRGRVHYRTVKNDQGQVVDFEETPCPSCSPPADAGEGRPSQPPFGRCACNPCEHYCRVADLERERDEARADAGRLREALAALFLQSGAAQGTPEHDSEAEALARATLVETGGLP